MPKLRPSAYSVSDSAPTATSNTPAAIATRGRFQASATSATPVTVNASAVLNDIGFWLPNRSTGVARTNQATITDRPTPAHSRPPAMTIASGTRPPRDTVPAGPSAVAGGWGGDGGGDEGGGRGAPGGEDEGT